MTTTATTVQPYVFFGGRCEEALGFYREALGAETLMLVRFRDSPEPAAPGMLPEGYEEKVMHATVRIGATTFMASDGGCSEVAGRFEGFSLSLNVPDEAAAERAFSALAAGGEVRMPLARTFWSPRFGMLQDRFGMGWMISVVSGNEAG